MSPAALHQSVPVKAELPVPGEQHSRAARLLDLVAARLVDAVLAYLDGREALRG